MLVSAGQGNTNQQLSLGKSVINDCLDGSHTLTLPLGVALLTEITYDYTGM